MKYFLKITREYSVKNKLQNLIIEEIKPLNHLLYPSLFDAKEAVNKAYKTAINSYKGNAKIPELKIFKSTEKEKFVFYIEDVFYLSLYEVIKEME